MTDELISRQAAIKDAESWVAVDEYEKHLQKNVVEWLKELPPAQLGTNLAEVGADCISKQAALEWCLEGLNNMPSEQPEIIRCKDCKHWIPYDWMFSEIWRSRNMADYPEDEIGCDCCDMAMKANDFCSRQERRTDERSNQQTGSD